MRKSDDTTHSFREVVDLMNQAVASERGIKVTSLPSVRHARNLVTRMNTYRSRERKKTEEIYPEGHPERGATVYDQLILSFGAAADGSGEVIMRRPSGRDYEVVDL